MSQAAKIESGAEFGGDSAAVRAVALAARKPPSYGPFCWLQSVWSNRALVLRLTRREIESRYKGSFFGLVWSLVIPIMLLAVYTFVFSVIFQAKWDAPQASRGHFALLLFSGLIAFNLFADTVNRAPSLMLANVAYIKRVVFPLEILPWVTACSAAFQAFVSFVALAIGYAIVVGVPPWTAILCPLLLAPYILMIVGISLFLSSIGVFVRDLQQVIGIVTMMVMFLTPIFYPISAIPESYRPFIAYSPLAIVVEGMREVLFWGGLPSLSLWLGLILLSWASVWLGYVWFMKTKKGFADVV